MNKKTKNILITGSLCTLLGSTAIGSTLGISQNQIYIADVTLAQQIASVQPRSYDVAEPTLSQLPSEFGSWYNGTFNFTKYLSSGGVYNASSIFRTIPRVDDFISNMHSNVTASTNYWDSLIASGASFTTDSGNDFIVNPYSSSIAYSHKYVYAYEPQVTPNGNGVDLWLAVACATRGKPSSATYLCKMQINGFKLAPSSYTDGPITLTSTGMNLSNPNDVKTNDVVKNAIFKNCHGLAVGATASNIRINSVDPANKFNGTCTVKFQVTDKWIDNSGNITDSPEKTVQLSGFDLVNTTFTNNQTITVSSLNSVKASDFNSNPTKYQTQVADQIIAQGLIQNADGLDNSKIKISNPRLNAASNTVTVDVTLSSGYWNGGTQHANQPLGSVTVAGFQVLNSVFNNAPITLSSADIDLSNPEAVKSNEKTKQAILAACSPLASGASASNVEIRAVKEPNKFTGSCKVDFVVNNVWLTNNVAGNSPLQTVTINGYNKVSTSVLSTEVTAPLNNLYIHELTNADVFNANKDKIKQAIATSGVIQNPNGTITKDNITIEGSFNESTRQISCKLKTGWMQDGNPSADHPFTVTLSSSSFKPNDLSPSAISPDATSVILKSLPSKYTADLNGKETEAVNALNTKLGNNPTQIASNVSINGYPSTATFSNLVINGTSATVDVVISNWWAGGKQTPEADSGKQTIKLTLLADPAPISPESTVTPKPDSPIVQQAEQGSTVEEVQNNYADAMKNDIYTQIYDNCTTAQKAELDKLSPEQKKELLDSIQVDTTVEKNGDKLQITSSTINLKDFNSKLQGMGIQGFTQDSFEYTNPLPATNEGFAWWAILLIVVGSLLITALIITLILYKKKNKGYKGSYAY